MIFVEQPSQAGESSVCMMQMEAGEQSGYITFEKLSKVALRLMINNMRDDEEVLSYRFFL